MTTLFIILALCAAIYAFFIWAGIKTIKFGAKYITDPNIIKEDDEEFTQLKKALEQKEGRELSQEEVLEMLKDMLKEVETKLQPRLQKALAVIGLLIFCAFLF